MASVADKKRAKKARTVTLARTVAPRVATTTRSPTPAAAVRRQSGLEWMRSKGRISDAEYRAGLRYGRLERDASTEDAVLIKSCLDTDGVRGAGTPTFPGKIDTQAAAWRQQAREELAAARAALAFHAGMVAALDLICGRQLTAREITPVQREAEEIENGLRIALQMLVRHWGSAEAS